MEPMEGLSSSVIGYYFCINNHHILLAWSKQNILYLNIPLGQKLRMVQGRPLLSRCSFSFFNQDNVNLGFERLSQSQDCWPRSWLDCWMDAVLAQRLSVRRLHFLRASKKKSWQEWDASFKSLYQVNHACTHKHPFDEVIIYK